MNKIGKTLLTATLTIGFCLCHFMAAQAQTSNGPAAAPPAATTTNVFDDLAALPMSLDNLFATGVNTNDTLWQSNSLTLWEAAAFSSVKGVAGESTIGNDIGLEVPIHKLSLHIDSVTRFEQLFGDVACQQFGVGYDIIYYNILLTGGADCRYDFTDHHVRAAIYAETQVATGKFIAIFNRFSVVPGKNTALEDDIGMSFRLGKKW